MSTPNSPRMYRLNTTGAPANSFPGASSGRRGDFVIDDAGNLFFYGGAPALQGWQQIVSAPTTGAIVIQPGDSTGAGLNVTIHGGDAVLAGPGNGGDVLIDGGDAANGVGGDVAITSGSGSTDSGNITLTTSNVSPASIPGNISVILGDEGAPLSPSGTFSVETASGGTPLIQSSQALGIAVQQSNDPAPGAASALDSSAGTFVVGAASATFVLTNPKIISGSIVFGTVMTDIGAVTLNSIVINPALNTATFTFSAAVGANATIAFLIINTTV